MPKGLRLRAAASRAGMRDMTVQVKRDACHSHASICARSCVAHFCISMWEHLLREKPRLCGQIGISECGETLGKMEKAVTLVML